MFNFQPGATNFTVRVLHQGIGVKFASFIYHSREENIGIRKSGKQLPEHYFMSNLLQGYIALALVRMFV